MTAPTKQLVLCVAPWYPSNPVRWMADAFERVGCNVVRIGPTYNDHMDMEWPDSDKVKPDLRLPRALRKWRLDAMVDWCTTNFRAPDLLFTSEENYRTDIDTVDKIPHVLWSCDGWPENYERVDLWRPTVAYHNHPLGIRIHPRTEEHPRWKFMPGACAPWVHRDLGMERIYDWVLFATMYGQRPAICAYVTARGLKTLYGKANIQEYVEHHNRALSTLHNANGQVEVKWRFFETAAMGCVNITDHTPLLARLGYQPMIHFVQVPVLWADDEPWPSMESVATMVEVLKVNRKRWKSISDAAKQYTLNHHTYFHRIRTIFQDLGMGSMVEACDEQIGKIE